MFCSAAVLQADDAVASVRLHAFYLVQRDFEIVVLPPYQHVLLFRCRIGYVRSGGGDAEDDFLAVCVPDDTYRDICHVFGQDDYQLLILFHSQRVFTYKSKKSVTGLQNRFAGSGNSGRTTVFLL